MIICKQSHEIKKKEKIDLLTLVYFSQISKLIFKIIIPNTQIVHLPEAYMTHNAKPLVTSFIARPVARVVSCQIWTFCKGKDSNIFPGKQPRAQSFLRALSVALNMGPKVEVEL